MKRFLSIFIIILLLVVLQTGLLAPWFPEYGLPDLALMFLVAGVAVFGFYPVWRWSILAGIMFDIFAYARPGTHVIIFLLAIYAISFVSRRMLVGERILGLLLVALLIFPITLWDRWGYAFLSGHWPMDVFAIRPGRLLAVVAWNILLFFISLQVIRRFKRYFGPQEYKIVRN